jgi:hypothetical protein
MEMLPSSLPPLGACAPVTEVLAAPAARFRLQFTDDKRTKELRWVLFSCTDGHSPLFALLPLYV